MSRLSVLDAVFFSLERPETPMHVGCLQVFRKPRAYDRDFIADLLDGFRSATRVRKPFAHVLTPPNPGALPPMWKQDRRFDIDYHVRHIALPKPGSMEQLHTLVGHLHSHLLDRYRPLWELYVIEGLKGNRFALFFKAHHGCVDGVGGMRLMQSALSDSAEQGGFRAPWEDEDDSGKKPSVMHSARKALVSALRQQSASIPEVIRAYRRAVREFADPAMRRALLPYAAPKSILNTSLSGNRMFASQKLPLKRVKAVAKMSDATVNDVLLTVCAGALREWLQEMDELPREPLIAGVPMSIRMEGEDAGNRITVLLCDLGTRVRNHVSRMHLIKSSINRSKLQQEDMSAVARVNYLLVMVAPFTLMQMLGIAGKVRPPYNLVISNVPGPTETRYLNGAKLEELYPVSLLPDTQALNITLFSYDGSVQLGIVSCRQALSGIERFAELLEQSWQELEAEAKEHYGRRK